jgi:hypothetical protein
MIFKIESKAVPVRDRENPKGCDTSRPSHFLDNRLRDGDDIVSFTRLKPFNSKKFAGTDVFQWQSRPEAHIAAGRIRAINLNP